MSIQTVFMSYTDEKMAFLVHLCFCLAGFAVLSVGVLIFKDFQADFLQELLSNWKLPSFAYIIIGLVFVAMSLIGALATYTGSNKIFLIYIIIIGFTISSQICIGIFSMTKWNTVETALLDALKTKFHPGEENSDAIYDEMQRKLHCCGINGPTDYTDLEATVPASCLTLHQNTFWSDGCFYVLRSLLRESSVVMVGVGVGFGILEVLGLALIMKLSSVLRGNTPVS